MTVDQVREWFASQDACLRGNPDHYFVVAAGRRVDLGAAELVEDLTEGELWQIVGELRAGT